VHGATVDRIPLTELPAWPITVPEQAGRLESLLGAIGDMTAQRERENETLAALRETLMPKLMSGQIRVRDAAKVLEEAL
jgi:type I restriction enzyme S subunit